MNEIAEQVFEYYMRFLPKVEPPEGQRVSAHSLLYDFNDVYPDVYFTVEELWECVRNYLLLLEPIIRELEQVVGTIDKDHREFMLYDFMLMQASELVLAYFQRTNIDEKYDDFVRYMVERDAASEVKRVLDLVDIPLNETRDVTSRIYSVYYALEKLKKDYSTP